MAFKVGVGLQDDVRRRVVGGFIHRVGAGEILRGGEADVECDRLGYCSGHVVILLFGQGPTARTRCHRGRWWYGPLRARRRNRRRAATRGSSPRRNGSTSSARPSPPSPPPRPPRRRAP